MHIALKALAAVIGIVVAVFAARVFISRTTPVSTEDVYARWNEGIGETADTVFRYPRDLGLAYVTAAAWPPVVQVSRGLFTCNPTSEEESYQAQVAWRTVGKASYCVSLMREGAAGSEYDSYEYTTSRGEAIIRVSFTVQRPQCMNYDEPQQGACKREQSAFDADALAASIVETIRSPLLLQ
ncbi:hypothetical protein FJY94_00520 [Candidatus Kaiserbacteria bacterium]|nr:hypothetical protein [Candidatus Kaiserbacteria bacterium]